HDGEEQSEGNIGGDDDGAAQVAEEHPLDEEHQKTTEHQIVHHGMGRHADQFAAIVIGHDLDAGRQGAVGIDLGDFLLDLGQDVVGVLGAAHDDDGGGDVVVVVASGNAEARHIADGDLAEIPDLDRHAIDLRQDDFFDVLDLVALDQIVVAAVVDQADAANIDRLLADGDFAAADVDIGVAQRGDDLGNGDIIGFELGRIELDMEFLGGAAPGVDLHDAGNGQQPARDDPVLDGAQIGQAEMLRSGDFIAENFAGETGLLNLRNLGAGQIDVLLQADRRLGEGEMIIDAIFEGHADEAQAIERGRADIVDAGSRIEPDLHGNGIIFLHFLGRKPRLLGGDFENRRRRIRIGFDIQLAEGEGAGRQEDHDAEYDDGAARQAECEQCFNQFTAPAGLSSADGAGFTLSRKAAR